MNKISLKNAERLSSILGKCAIKNLGGELFIPVIKAKSSLTAIVKKYAELELEVFKQYGFPEGVVPPNGTSMEALQGLSKAQKDLSELKEDVEDLKLFTLDQLQKLSDENPKLTTSELEIIFELMTI